MTHALQDIDHIHVTVADRAAAEVWYRDALGPVCSPELAVSAADGGPLTLQNRTGTVHLALFERPAAASRSVIARNDPADQDVSCRIARRRAAERRARPQR
jgi:hypothetical protein